MAFKYKDMIKALNAVEEERNIPMDVIVDALKEALAKAYKKDAELQDIDVFAEINDKDQTIDLYQNYVVVNEEDLEDDELEISLDDAKKINPDAKVGDKVARKVELRSMSRAAATLARNVMRQKIREAEKMSVYDEYIDQLHDMVLGVVESVKDKFTLVNLGKTVAMMPRSQEIPGEIIREGQRIRVVITEVNKDTKGSQVLVSRADPMLVKRLFEKEVPEIYQGVVEIKAIAREAGERTKMAVMSHNPDVDPIGACIGPRGQRVQDIIEELNGEKIDIFEWNDDITELVRNALAPAEVEAVLPGDDDHSLLVVVRADQLSLAIGKRGKNARLAVKLTDHKIDIKTREDLEKMGKDYDALVALADQKREEMRMERQRREMKRLAAVAKEAEQKRLEEAARIIAAKGQSNLPEAEEDGFIPEEMQESMQERFRNEMAMGTSDKEDSADESGVKERETEEGTAVEEQTAAVPEEPLVSKEETQADQQTMEEADTGSAPEAEEKPVEEENEEPVKETAEEKKQEPAVERRNITSRKHADLEEMAAKNDYVSVFEKLTDTSKPKETPSKYRKKKKKSEEEEYKVRNKELEKQIRSNFNINENRPVYTDEELAEIEAEQQAEEEREYDFEYDDEYDDYYDDEDQN